MDWLFNLAVPNFDPFVLVLDTITLNEWDDGPTYATISVTKPWIQSIISRAGAVAAAGIRVALYEGDDSVWADRDESLCMQGTDLGIIPVRSNGVIRDAEVFFRGHPRHADYDCETRDFSIVDLVECITRRKTGDAAHVEGFSWHRHNDVMVYDGGSGSAGDLAEQYEEDLAASAESA